MSIHEVDDSIMSFLGRGGGTLKKEEEATNFGGVSRDLPIFPLKIEKAKKKNLLYLCAGRHNS